MWLKECVHAIEEDGRREIFFFRGRWYIISGKLKEMIVERDDGRAILLVWSRWYIVPSRLREIVVEEKREREQSRVLVAERESVCV